MRNTITHQVANPSLIMYQGNEYRPRKSFSVMQSNINRNPRKALNEAIAKVSSIAPGQSVKTQQPVAADTKNHSII